MAQIPNSAFCTLYWNNQSALAVNVIGMAPRPTSVFNQSVAETLGAAIKAAFTANLALVITTTCSLVRVGIRDMRSPNQPEFRDTGAAVAGTAPGDALPPQTALVITLRTNGAGKSFRGRIYLPGWGENNNVGTGTQGVTTNSSSIAFLQAVRTAMTNSLFDMAVVSRPSERTVFEKTTFHADGSSTVRVLSTTQAKPGGSSIVTAFEGRNAAWETQRRRNNGRGPAPATLTQSLLVPVE